MPKLSQVAKATTQTVLVYGPPKSGKTELAGKLASDFDILYIGMENGHQTMTKFPPEWQDRITIVNLPDTRSYPIAIETCLKIVKGNKWFIDDTTGKAVAEGQRKPNTEYTEVHLDSLPVTTVVIFDSLTQLTNSAIAHITKAQPDDYKMQYDDWGNLGKLLDIFLSHVQQSKANIICISHETEAEMEDGKMKIVPTAGTRNFSRNTAKYFGHVVYVNIVNKAHKFTSSTTAILNTIVGSRTDIAIEEMKEPSLLPIFKGETGTKTPQTNGQVAASRLSALSASLKKT